MGGPTLRVNYQTSDGERFDTTNPFDGPDEDRILDEDTELRKLKSDLDRERIMNAITVRYAGMGTGEPQEETDFITDTNSIDAFGRREAVVYTPWIDDQTTAQKLANTLIEMYNGQDDDGNYNGIRQIEATLYSGELQGDDFNANVGDKVGVRRSNGTQLTGRFMGFEYEQMREALTVRVGLPKPSRLAKMERNRRRHEEVETNIQSTTATGQAGSPTRNTTGAQVQDTINVNSGGVEDIKLRFANEILNLADDDGFTYKIAITAQESVDYQWKLYEDGEPTPYKTMAVTTSDDTSGRQQSWTDFIPSHAWAAIVRGTTDVNGEDPLSTLQIEIINNDSNTSSDFSIEASAWVKPKHTHGT
jgi:hypothetical protein